MTKATAPRSRRGLAVLSFLASGGLAFFAITRSWWQTTILTAGMPKTDVYVTGSSVVPWTVGVALVVMAAALGVLAGAPIVRRMLGGIVGLLAIAAVVGISTASAQRAKETALDVAAVSGAAATWDPNIWRSIAVAAFLAAAASGVWVLLRGQTWANMSSKYDAPQVRREDEEIDAWKMIDEGIDPTE